MRIWINGSHVEEQDASISIMDHGVLYGDGCFEGIRSYNGRIFKLESHLDRMWESARRLRLTPPYPRDEIAQVLRDMLEANGGGDSYIRLVFTRGAGSLGLHPFRCPKASCFIILDTIKLYPEELYKTGMQIVLADRPRVPRECLDPAIKSLNYLNNILAKIEAIDEDKLEALMLNTEGWVAECTGDNIFIVKDGKVATPPVDVGILAGITRRFAIDELCPALNFSIEEKMMRIEEVLHADEVFLTGTAAEVIGVTHIGDHLIGNAKVGPVTTALEAEFRRRVATDAAED